MVIRIVNHLSPNDSHGQRLFNAQCVADFNRFILNWQTPLQLAAIRNDADACRLLVQAGADADASHPMGNSATALQRACFYSDYDAAKALVFRAHPQPSRTPATCARLTGSCSFTVDKAGHGCYNSSSTTAVMCIALAPRATSHCL